MNKKEIVSKLATQRNLPESIVEKQLDMEIAIVKHYLDVMREQDISEGDQIIMLMKERFPQFADIIDIITGEQEQEK